MVDVKPLNAIVYNQSKVDIKDVIAPPYHVITHDEQQKLYERSKYNIVRLILSSAKDRYQDAKESFENWQKEGVLIKTEKPSIFYIIQKYTTENGRKVERKGFIAKNHVEEFSTKKILPHEYTMGGPKEDRLKLTRACEANFSQIFMVYSDPSMTVENEIAPKYTVHTPFIDVTDDKGVQNLVYIIDDENDIAKIHDLLKDKTLLIADGHHRYETALNYSKEAKNPEAQYVMSYFTNSEDDNLIIFPTHRIITKFIEPYVLLESVKKYYDMTDYTFTSHNKEQLDLTVLHELIISNELGYSKEEQMAQDGIKYIKQEFEAFDMIDKGTAEASFIMAYPKMQDIKDISAAGYRMPQKSTYFYPKLLSGVAINPLKG